MENFHLTYLGTTNSDKPPEPITSSATVMLDSPGADNNVTTEYSGMVLNQRTPLEKGTVKVGRGDRNEIRFPANAQSVSRNHGQFLVGDNQVIYQDSSTNGTKIAGETVKKGKKTFAVGDVVSFPASTILPGAWLHFRLETSNVSPGNRNTVVDSGPTTEVAGEE